MKLKGLFTAYGSAMVLAAGAGIYALVEGPGGATFFLTPAFFGLTAVLAGLLGSLRSLIGSGMSLMGWGAAVLLVHYGVIPADRTAPAYMFGVAAGVIATRIVAPSDRQGEWMTAAGLSAAFGAAGYYIAFGVSSIGRWPAWCLTVAVWAIYAAVVTTRRSGLAR